MILAIVGSRVFNEFEYAESEINKIISDFSYQVNGIVSGGAIGADSIARDYALKYDIPIKEYVPNWKLGKHAGMLRNNVIVEKSDVVIAFWNGYSPGTKDCIKKVKQTTKKIHIINYTNRRFNSLNL